jgi:P-type Ca2+ transporter type 2C
LNNLAELIAKIGSLAGVLLFLALLIRFFVQLGKGQPVLYAFRLFWWTDLLYSRFSLHRTASQKGIAFVNILIISVTVIVVAVPEGMSYPFLAQFDLSDGLTSKPVQVSRSL